jgi:hypothetical protein
MIESEIIANAKVFVMLAALVAFVWALVENIDPPDTTKRPR